MVNRKQQGLLYHSNAIPLGMAKAEQIVTDRKKMKKILEFMEEAVKEGLSKKEIM